MGVLLYTVSLYVYGAAIRLLALRGGKPGRFWHGRRGIMGNLEADMATEPRARIWIHAASLGEYEQAIPLLEAIRKEYPDYALVLTLFSPSGWDQAKAQSLADYLYYLPLDYPGAARRFLDRLRPSLAIFVKYEFWHYYIQEMRQRGIPLILVSAYFRPRQAFFRFYGGFFRSMLQGFHRIYVQDQGSRDLLARIGIDQVVVVGDTRFDRVLAYSRQKPELPWPLNEFLDHPRVLVAGSTWPRDEAFLEQLLPLLGEDWKMILAPHQWDSDRLQRLATRFPGSVFFSSSPDPQQMARAQVLILDALGYLSRVYSGARLAYIGGGWGRKGVHNVLEAAVWAIPLAHGPCYAQYREPRELVECGGSWVVEKPQDLAAILKEGDTHSGILEKAGLRAADYVRAQSGATARIMRDISSFLSPQAE